MSFICRNCRKAVPEDCRSCPVCGAEIDPFGTIQAPMLRPGGLPSRPDSPDSASPFPDSPPRGAGPAPRDIEYEPPRPKVAKPAAPKPRPKPRPAAPPPAPAPQPPPAYQAPAYPNPYPPEDTPGTAESDSARPRHWFGRLKDAIGRAPGEADPGAAPPASATGPPAPTGPAPGAGTVPDLPPNGWAPSPPPPAQGPPAGPSPGSSWPNPAPGPGGYAGAPPGAWQPAPGGPGSSWPPPGPGGWGPAGGPYGQAAPTPAPPGQDDAPLQTMGIQGVDLGRLKIQSHQYVLQIYDRTNRWVEWQRIGPTGLKIGRVKESRQHPALSSMASRHLRLGHDGGRLIAEDLGSLNGVYRLVVRPVALEDGQRFRVGRYVVEFHAAGPRRETEPLVGEDGEEFCGFDLPSLGHLDFIGRDGRPGPRHVLTKAVEPTVLGRGGRPGRPVDVALSNDDRISGVHAQLRFESGQFFLEDLGSRNGTFVQLRRPTAVEHDDVLLVGQLMLRVAAVGS